MTKLKFETTLPVSQQTLYDYHASGAALDRLNPPWETVEVTQWRAGEQRARLPIAEQYGDISLGAEVHLRLNVGPFKQVWVAKHIEHTEPTGFTDRQEKGPFKTFVHQHRFVEVDAETTMLRDELDFQLPFAPISALAKGFVMGKLSAMFAYRHARTKLDLQRSHRCSPELKKRVLISGASGLVGQALSSYLRSIGHHVAHLVRREPRNANEIQWDIRTERLSSADIEGFDAVVHLAGESIDGRWTRNKKRKIRESRTRGTALLARALSRCERPPSVLVSASGISAYQDTGAQAVDENGPLAADFLGTVCAEWEVAASPAAAAGIRVVHPRIGLVLSRKGGALARMLLPFQLGLGGPIGHAQQWMSWIALEDLIGLLCEAIFRPDVQGVFNAVAPNPVQNREFVRTLGSVLNRPAIAPLPSFVVRTLFGEMGETLLLNGLNVRSTQPLVKEYPWCFTELESALRFELFGELDGAN